jgi:RNA-directed DNA polymerase
VANLSEMAKPALESKQCSNADFRLSGVKEDGAIRKCIQEHERPAQADGGLGQVSAGRKEIIFQRASAGVGAARSSDEATNNRGAKGPQWKHAESDEQRSRLNDQRSTTGEAEGSKAGQPAEPHLPPRLAALRQKLAQKAKQEPKFRFYSLYGGVMDKDTLLAAWWKVLGNKGAPGVDGVSIEQIVGQENGVENLLTNIGEELKTRTYRPQPVKRVYIPKANGKMRPLGIPTVKDRVVQMAVLLVLEPIFETDFQDCSYGFRPGRSAHMALDEIRQYLLEGKLTVYDADLKGYFDSIPHDKLMACVKMRVVDGSVLKLIEMWLEAPVVEPPEKPGGKPTVRRNDKGTPQGGVISPLLANIYLHWFDKVFHSINGPAKWANARLVRYADDFVVLARHQSKQLRDYIETKLEKWLGLEINREKTRVINVKEESLDFLGYTFCYVNSRLYPGTQLLSMRPSKKSVQRQKDALRELTDVRRRTVPLPDLIRTINRQLRGWSNYFDHGYWNNAFNEINNHVLQRLHIHLRGKSQRPYRIPEDQTLYQHLQKLGWVHLRGRVSAK